MMQMHLKKKKLKEKRLLGKGLRVIHAKKLLKLIIMFLKKWQFWKKEKKLEASGNYRRKRRS